MQPLIVTLTLDAPARERFDALRRRHFPPERNHLAAHLTLFHALPGELEQQVRQDLETAAYLFRADPANWKRLLAGEMDPVSAVMQGKLKLSRGNLFTLAKYAPAAREMVVAAGEVGGTFPPAAA